MRRHFMPSGGLRGALWNAWVPLGVPRGSLGTSRAASGWTLGELSGSLGALGRRLGRPGRPSGVPGCLPGRLLGDLGDAFRISRGSWPPFGPPPVVSGVAFGAPACPQGLLLGIPWPAFRPQTAESCSARAPDALRNALHLTRVIYDQHM